MKLQQCGRPKNNIERIGLFASVVEFTGRRVQAAGEPVPWWRRKYRTFSRQWVISSPSLPFLAASLSDITTLLASLLGANGKKLPPHRQLEQQPPTMMVPTLPQSGQRIGRASSFFRETTDLPRFEQHGFVSRHVSEKALEAGTALSARYAECALSSNTHAERTLSSTM